MTSFVFFTPPTRVCTTWKSEEQEDEEEEEEKEGGKKEETALSFHLAAVVNEIKRSKRTKAHQTSD